MHIHDFALPQNFNGRYKTVNNTSAVPFIDINVTALHIPHCCHTNLTSLPVSVLVNSSSRKLRLQVNRRSKFDYTEERLRHPVLFIPNRENVS
jgi:hypothetical protein